LPKMESVAIYKIMKLHFFSDEPGV
jgi:hypothetical protein